MKQIMMNGFISFAVVMLSPQILQAQGAMTYLSSLSTNSTGSPSVGSDSWLAALFGTGNNAGGYSLDSIQLGMADASGNPSNFTVMIYSANIGGAVTPGSNLGTLDGSLNPVLGGIFTYTPASILTLLPRTAYFVVLTAGTTVADGAYNWNMNTFPPSSSGNWSADNAVLQSSDGTSHWSSITLYDGIGQFAINAIPIPEPGVLSLFGLGGLAFLWHHRKMR